MSVSYDIFPIVGYEVNVDSIDKIFKVEPKLAEDELPGDDIYQLDCTKDLDFEELLEELGTKFDCDFHTADNGMETKVYVGLATTHERVEGTGVDDGRVFMGDSLDYEAIVNQKQDLLALKEKLQALGLKLEQDGKCRVHMVYQRG